MYAGNANLDALSGRVKGDYGPNLYNFINATLVWRF